MKSFLVTVDGGNDEIIKAININEAKKKFIRQWNYGTRYKDNPFTDVADIREIRSSLQTKAKKAVRRMGLK